MAAFRIAEQKDAPILAATRQKVWDATYRGIYPDEMIEQYDLAFFTAKDYERISNPENKIWLAMDAELCVGYLVVGQMEAGLHQGAVHRREGVEKLRAPDPRRAGQGLFRPKNH